MHIDIVKGLILKPILYPVMEMRDFHIIVAKKKKAETKALE